MSSLSLRQALRITVAGVALGLSALPAFAQTADVSATSSGSDAVTLTEIVVAGQRRSQARALQEQHDSLTVANVVSAEELQAQPTANLADLLSRLPGLSSAVDQSRNQAGTGEAQYVTIRGLDSAWNAYSMNGVRLAQTDSAARSISMNLLSPFSLSFVRVDKAPTAEMDGDALAGTVDFRTASGFDFASSYNRLRIQGQLADRAIQRDVDGLGYTAQVELARTFGGADQFAVYGNLYYQDKDNAGESRAVQQDYVKTDSTAPGLVREQGTNLYARGPQWNFYRNSVKRQGGALSLDYKTDAQSLYGRFTHGEFELLTSMDQSSARLGLATAPSGSKELVDFLTAARPSSAWQINGDSDPKNIKLYGAIPGQYSRTEHSTQTLTTALIGGETIRNALTLDYAVSYSKGRTEYPFRMQAGFYAFPYIGTADQGGKATVPLLTDISDPKDPRAVLDAAGLRYLGRTDITRQWYITYGYEYAEETKLDFKTNLNWSIEHPILKAIKVGAKYETSDRESNNVGTDDENRFYFYKKDANGNWTTNPALLGNGSNRWAAQGDYLFDLPGQTLNGFMGGGLQVPIRLVDPEYLKNQAMQYAATIPWTDEVMKRNLLTGDETRASAYAQTTLTFGDTITVVPGLRYEDNNFEGTYWRPESVTGKDGKTVTNRVSATSDRGFGILLPSVIATWRPNEEIVVRGAVRRAYTRPAFDQMIGATSISKDADGKIIAISIANPDLQPVTGVNYDLSIEKYGDDGHYLMASLYYKDLKNVMFVSGSTNTGSDYNVWTGDVIKDAGGAEVTSLENAKNGSVQGLELGIRQRFVTLPGLWDGFGIGANLTVQKTEAQLRIGGIGDNVTRRLINAPDSIVNASLFYNKYGLRAELAYSRVGMIYKDVRNNNDDTWVQPMRRLNFNANYQLADGWQVGAAVENILNDQSYWATQGKGEALLSHDRKGGYVETGRTFMVNSSWTF
ncbi:TonB-dependent receptor [Brevundimonas mediterranea]|uniref:TonB-dependent receptor n=1 Tax=Brevundimonas mediterranea TaxID=74329 RepID=A0A7W6A266_9CAUL|nr:TonB-dependent receptor [Brevundimonas mediterranea]